MPPPKPQPTQPDETLTFLWTCLKNSGDYKIDYKAVGEALNLTTGAANKRFSRLKQRMDAETGGQASASSPTKGGKRNAEESGVDGEGEESPKKKQAKGKGPGKGKAKKAGAAGEAKVKGEANSDKKIENGEEDAEDDGNVFD